MKDAEDEAFDDLAKRQGDWGSGFQAKRAAAADKLQEPPSEWASIKAILDEYGLQAIDFVADFKAALAQPAQKPVAFDEFLESQDFYELMQIYRHCLIDAFLPFEKVKNALRAAHIREMK